jgi:AcrR family transcriptional regulator
LTTDQSVIILRAVVAALRTRSAPNPAIRPEQLLDAARRVFAARGYSAATVQDVADAAGVAKGTVYLYFASKEELYLAALRKGLDELFVCSTDAVEAARGAEAKLRAFVETRFRQLDANRDFFRIYVLELGRTRLRSGGEGSLEEPYRLAVELLRRLLEDGIAAGELRPLRRPESAAAMLLDLVRGQVALRLAGRSQATLEDDVDDVFSLIWRGIAP